MSGSTTRRDWLRTNLAALGWVAAGGPGLAHGAETRSPAASGRRQGIVRLCYNENPHGPGPGALAAISEQASRGNRYGLELQSQLRQAIAQANGVGGDQVALGSGSSEILALATSLAARKGPGHILMGSPSFTSWLSPAGQLGLETRTIRLDEGHRHDLPSMAAAINDSTRMVYLCNPGNPTGTVSPDKELRDFIRQAAAKTLVVVDEAYFEYVCTGSVADMTKELPNLVVTRTFSKLYGLAGLRVGYGVGQMAGALAAREGWPNAGVSSLSMGAALASLRDGNFAQDARQKTREAMDFATGNLKTLGLEYIPSVASFVMFDTSGFKGDMADALEKRGVQVRNWEMKRKRWCRVSMGTMEEMEIFADRLKAVLKA